MGPDWGTGHYEATAAELLPAAEQLVTTAGVRTGEHAVDVGCGIDDASQDAVLSSFGVVFTPDPPSAAADLVRVLRPGGRVAVSAWVPGGPIDAMIGAGMRLLAQRTGQAGPGGPAFPWHDGEAVADLFAGTGRDLSVRTTQQTISFTGRSATAYFDEVQAVHPLAVLALRTLEQVGGDPAEARAAMVAVLEEHNEDPSAFRVTSRYAIHVIG